MAAAPQALAAATARRDVEARGEERIRRSGGRVGGGTALYMAHGQGASSGLVWDHGVGLSVIGCLDPTRGKARDGNKNDQIGADTTKARW